MNIIDKKFKELKKQNKKAFIAYMTAGFPNLKFTENFIKICELNNVDILELGIPFSDPLADGPVIQEASALSLKKGTNISKVLALVKKLRKTNIKIPIVFMSYANPILSYGTEIFFKQCKQSGVNGVIVPDLPVEEVGGLHKIAKKHGIDNILLMAPTTTDKRLKKIAKLSQGFIYYVSLTGTTGVRRHLPTDIRKRVRKIKLLTRKPVCVGFGISSTEQAANITAVADGIIVGSAIVKLVLFRKSLKSISDFVFKLAQTVHNA